MKENRELRTHMWSLFPRCSKTDMKDGNIHAFIWTINMNNKWTLDLMERICVCVCACVRTGLPPLEMCNRLLWERQSFLKSAPEASRLSYFKGLFGFAALMSGVSALLCDWHLGGLLSVFFQARLHKGRLIGPGTASLGILGRYYLTRWIQGSQKPARSSGCLIWRRMEIRGSSQRIRLCCIWED